ncbi:C39 family peptidase [Domibacillus robiginosus]|uniref:C39 family peptidase n=1 Tax=Domibacillus robiginosus TaxID=1071054 RepID=UPI00067D8B54|nr:C39 family peptidase [Domibacillus robiginosus]
MIQVKSQSQYAEHIKKQYRSSACGPVTVSVILDFWGRAHTANELYKKLGTTKIGLFRWMMVWRLRKLLGNSWHITSSNRIDKVIQELDLGHPVAAKFDKYFTLRFFAKPLYTYHWVVLTGYKIQDGHIYLFFHDHGSPGRKSTLRRAAFEQEAGVLRFVLLSPKKPPL